MRPSGTSFGMELGCAFRTSYCLIGNRCQRKCFKAEYLARCWWPRRPLRDRARGHVGMQLWSMSFGSRSIYCESFYVWYWYMLTRGNCQCVSILIPVAVAPIYQRCPMAPQGYQGRRKSSTQFLCFSESVKPVTSNFEERWDKNTPIVLQEQTHFSSFSYALEGILTENLAVTPPELWLGGGYGVPFIT